MKYCPLCDRTYDDAVEVCATDGAALRVSRSKQDTLLDKVIKGRYRVLKKLGEGGMGAVYLADQFAINRKVALKILHPDFAKDEDFVRRFRQEATLAASFSHQNVITVFDFDQADDGSLYIVMEYVDGHNLSDVIRDEPMDLASALQLAIQIAGGLSAAHRAGVIHRDIKPENIMVVGGGKEVKLMDFGIARLRDRTATTRLTQTGMIMGTPVYMAPEQIEGGDLSERTDIYAFGIVLYEMLTGRVPFKATTPGAILVKHLHEAPIPLSKVRKEIPSSVERIVTQALQKSPEKRQKSMDEVVDALKKAQRDAEQLGIGGVHSFAPQMAAVRRGLSAVAAPFRNFLSKGTAETVPSRSTDHTEPTNSPLLTEKLGSDPQPSPDLAITGAGAAAPPSDIFESSDATRFEQPLVMDQTHQSEAQFDPSPIDLEENLIGPGEIKEMPAAQATESIAQTVAFTVPLQVPEQISEPSEFLTDIHEVADVAPIGSEAASATVQPSPTNVADITVTPSSFDSVLAPKHEPLLGEPFNRMAPSEHQATVTGGGTELSAAPSNETISVTSILSQPTDTGTSLKKNWFIGAIVSVFVMALALFGGMKLFRQFTSVPVDSTPKMTSDATTSAAREIQDQSETPTEPIQNNESLPTPFSPGNPAVQSLLREPPAIKSKSRAVEPGDPSSGSTAIGTIEKNDLPATKKKESRERNANKPPQEIKPAQKAVTNTETKKPEAPSKKPLEPAADNRIAVLKAPEPQQQQIELKDLLIVPGKKELKVKERMMLTAKGRYSDGKETEVTSGVQWRSSNASVASVNSKGELEALKEGRTQITAIYDGVASSSFALNVRPGEDNQKSEPSGDQIKDLRRRLLR